MTWEKSVYSTMAQSIGYDAEKEEMVVTWRNGRVSIYSGVPEGLALEASTAASVGQFLNSEVKPIYSHRYG